MAFRMVTDITIGRFEKVQVHSVSWERSIDNYSDTAKITLPAVARMKRADGKYDRVNTADQLMPGMPVRIAVGYDATVPERFTGFISRVKHAIPLVVECEGYSWQLRQKTFTRSYGPTTVRQILTDLVQGTDIVLSDAMPEVPLPKALFRNVYGTQVLDWLKEKCLLTVYFEGNVLYAGGQSLQPFSEVKFLIGWNTAAEEQLSYLTEQELAQVIINANHKDKQGNMVIPITDLKGDVKELKTLVADSGTLAAISAEQTRKRKFTGYKGSLTAFSLPLAAPGMTAVIKDQRYPDRSGRYFINAVKGEHGPRGGRQRIEIGYYLGAI